MNHVYRVLWDAITGTWVVVSELITTKKKSSRRKIRAAVAIASLGASALASATDVNDLNFNPTDCDGNNNSCQVVVSNGDSTTL